MGMQSEVPRNSRGKKFKNPDDEEKMSAQSLVGVSDYKKMKCAFCTTLTCEEFFAHEYIPNPLIAGTERAAKKRKK